jgi:hypothetical protein
VAIISIGPNVCPASVDILATGISDVWFVSHHVTMTFGQGVARDIRNKYHEGEGGSLLS